MTSLLSFVLAQAPGQPDPLQNMLSTILPFAAIILIFYFMMIRPQQKRQKEMKSMLDAMKKEIKSLLLPVFTGQLRILKIMSSPYK